MLSLRSVADLLVLAARESSSLAARARTWLGRCLHATLVAVLPDLHTDEAAAAEPPAPLEPVRRPEDTAAGHVHPLRREIRMLERGFATAEDIDQGLVRGAAHPQCPLALDDLFGLDTTKTVAEPLYEEFEEPPYAPPPLLARMVDAGLLGRKTGRSSYDY